MKILIASRNAHKIQEIREIFDLPGVEWVSTAAFPDLRDVVEDGDTFEANAVKKATELARATGLWALADDSGAPAALSTEMVLASPSLRTTTRYLSGGTALSDDPKLISLPRKPGSFLSPLGAT